MQITHFISPLPPYLSAARPRPHCGSGRLPAAFGALLVLTLLVSLVSATFDLSYRAFTFNLPEFILSSVFLLWPQPSVFEGSLSDGRGALCSAVWPRWLLERFSLDYSNTTTKSL